MSGLGRGKKAAAESARSCGNLGCDVTGSDKVNKEVRTMHVVRVLLRQPC